MYAVIRAGGKQYRVAPGDVIRVETQDDKDGKVEFGDVLAVSAEAGSIVRPGAEEMAPRALGPSFALHSMFELGYQIGDGHSLTLSLDRATTPDFLSERNEFNNLHLRYGLKF